MEEKDSVPEEPKPETGEPRPEAGEPKPETGEPRPEAGEPRPEAGEPKEEKPGEVQPGPERSPAAPDFDASKLVQSVYKDIDRLGIENLLKEGGQKPLDEEDEPEPEPAPAEAAVQEQAEQPAPPAEKAVRTVQPPPEEKAKSGVEALLFASPDPLTPARLGRALGVPAAKVRIHLKTLRDEYESRERGFRLVEIAEGWRIMTDPFFAEWVQRLRKAHEEAGLSPAAVETLAIIAYKQPVIRADIESIRGVGCGPILRGLMEKGLVRIAGRADVLGRPLLYGTTRKFLEHFGLATPKDLPRAEDLAKG